ncbi:hypothetical protein BTZ20_5348 [Rhodococcus sp. MTM3W5.2]|nr:hypothetical protein BTZ20_5348 [Rhodococcus sp. MTM3W5.2]
MAAFMDTAIVATMTVTVKTMAVQRWIWRNLLFEFMGTPWEGERGA